MKKFYYSLFAAATMLLATTSCSQEEDFAQQSSNEVTTFSVSLDGAVGSRTVGDGTTATKLYYEVYRGNDCIIDANTVINTTAQIEMPLLKGETYDIVFWAQADGAIYKVDNLKNITIDYTNTNLMANQESYDAFYNALGGFQADGKSHTIELRRPLAQLNLGTDDWNKAMEGLTTAEKAEGPVTHTSVKVSGLADTFNPLTGKAEGDATAEFKLSTIPSQDKFTSNGKEYKYLSFNYLLVPSQKAPQGEGEYVKESSDEKANVDLTFALNRGEKELFTIKVPNAPVQRNWRTNVVGSLLTGSKFDVVIEEGFDDEYNHDAQAALKEVLTNGGDFTLFSDITLTENLTVASGVTANINLDGHVLNVNSTVSVKGNLNVNNGKLNIAVSGDDLNVGIYAFDGSKVDLKDTDVKVADKNAAVLVNSGATVTMNVINTKMEVAATAHGISMNPFAAKYVDVNVTNSEISGNGYSLYVWAENADITIDEKSSLSNIWVEGGDVVVKHAGEQPTVNEGNLAHTITYVQLNTTTFEGIYKVDGTQREYNVTSAEGMQNLNQLLASVVKGEGKVAIINLTTDIDLAGQNWIPLEGMWVTFNGNGHTIKNMTVSTIARSAANVRKAGFYGYAGGVTINDLTIENANVTGSQAGIFAGSGEGLTINNCYLKGTNTVTWAATEETWNGIGAITGVLQTSTINVEIAEGATVTLNKAGFTTDSNCKFVDNLTGYISKNNGSVTNNGSVVVPYTASENDDLKDALNSGANNITLPEGEYSLPSLAATEGVTIIGAEDGSTVIGGDNATTGFASNFGKNTTIKNVTFSGSSNGVRWSYANGGTTTFENCTFAGSSTYGFHIDQSKDATFIFNNCTFSGFNAFASDLKSVTFNNCTFKHNGSYGHTNIWSVANFNNCTWEDNTSVSQGYDSKTKKYHGTLYFNGNEESYHHEFIGSAKSLIAFAKSVNEDKDSWKGQAVILVDDIDLNNETWTPIGQTGATEFKGIFDGQNHTIKNLKVDSSAPTGGHYSSGLFGWAESGVTIKNVKVDGATVTGNHNVAVIVGYTYSGKISNCHVSNANIVCNHANDDACGDKCGLIAGYAADESRISDCSAIDGTVKAGRDAGQLIGCGYNVSVSNCTATNVVVSATGECTGANVNNAIIGRVMK